MLLKPKCLHFSLKPPDCLPDGSGAASLPVTNCHECARLSNLEKRRQEEAPAHIGLLNHGYYYYINGVTILRDITVAIHWQVLYVLGDITKHKCRKHTRDGLQIFLNQLHSLNECCYVFTSVATLPSSHWICIFGNDASSFLFNWLL
jgi:hypothetical protein